MCSSHACVIPVPADHELIAEFKYLSNVQEKQ